MDTKELRKLVSSINRKERRKAARLIRVSRQLKSGGSFTTGNGRVNKVIHVDKKYLYVRTINGPGFFKIPLRNIERMLAYFYRVRVIERKQLEIFSNFSSCLFGILKEIYKQKSRISKAGNVLRLIMDGIRVFIAGADKCPKDLYMAAAYGAKHILMSYFWIRKGKAWKRHLIKSGLRLLLDSGKFSEWSMEKCVLSLDDYIAFIKEHSDVIERYFVFDEIGDWGKTMENLTRMEEAGLKPIPIYHLGTPIENLDYLVQKGYEIIGLGGTVGQRNVKNFLLMVFNRYPNQAFHGLGITRAEYLNSFPFFSVDSRSWLQCRIDQKVLTRRGQIRMPDLTLSERLIMSFKYLMSLEKPRVFKNTPSLGYQAILFS